MESCFDSAYADANCSAPPGCSDYTNFYKDPEGQWGLLAVASIVATGMAFFIGANDAANAWATSVGSNAISLRTACIVAGCGNFIGAVTLGYGVSSKITKGVAKVDTPDCWGCGYSNSKMSVYAVGMVAALVGAALVLVIGTFTRMPVSTTHSIVGGVVGVTAFGVGFDCLNWEFPGGLLGIVASWGISPLFAGIIGAIVYVILVESVIKAKNTAFRSKMAYVICITVSTFLMVFILFLKASVTKNEFKSGNPYWESGLAAAGSALIASIVALKVTLPRVNTEVDVVLGIDEVAFSKREEKHSDIARQEMTDFSTEQRIAIEHFKHPLIYIAAWQSIAHGANDTANATAAFTQVLNSVEDGLYACNLKSTPTWIMAIGGLGVASGIWFLGYKVIQRVGREMVALNFLRSFCIEFGSTCAIMIATFLEMPVSTTHCSIGALVIVGSVSFGPSKAEWPLVIAIVGAWVLTVPCAAVVSGIFTSAGGYWELDLESIPSQACTQT